MPSSSPAEPLMRPSFFSLCRCCFLALRCWLLSPLLLLDERARDRDWAKRDDVDGEREREGTRRRWRDRERDRDGGGGEGDADGEGEEVGDGRRRRRGWRDWDRERSMAAGVCGPAAIARLLEREDQRRVAFQIWSPRLCVVRARACCYYRACK